MLVFIFITIVLTLGSFGLGIWLGLQWGKEQEQRQWQHLITIGELPRPGQPWLPAPPAATPPKSESDHAATPVPDPNKPISHYLGQA
jgi:hypothetical protein